MVNKRERKLYKEIKEKVSKLGIQKEYTNLRYVWKSMKNRCNNKKDRSYKHYGERGIRVCGRWNGKKSTHFIKWAIDNGYKPGLTIDRIDNDGNYSPQNCKFSTRLEQQKNKRIRKDTLYVRYDCPELGIYKNKKISVISLCKILKESYPERFSHLERGFVVDRIYRLGYCVDCAVSLPKITNRNGYQFKNHVCKNKNKNTICKFKKKLVMEQEKIGHVSPNIGLSGN